VDAQAAVNMAATWSNVGPETAIPPVTHDVNRAIPDNTTGPTDTITLGPEYSDIRVEHVEVEFNATHTWRGDLEIVLTSPAGVRSTLAAERLDDGDNYSGWKFRSVRHWEESPVGDWTLSVNDREALDVGTWQNWTLRIYGSSPAVVNAVSVNPNAGTGSTQTFTAQYTDSLGATDLSFVYLRFATTPAGATNTCMVRYDRAAGRLALRDNAGAWPAGVVPGTAVVQENSQCSINMGNSSVGLNGNTLTLNAAMTFKPAYGGARNIYLYAQSYHGVITDWQLRGTWTVPSGPVVTVDAVSVTPNAGTGATQAFTLQYTDTAGATDLSSARVRFGATNVGPGTCTAWYDAAAATIRLLDDAGAWGAPVALGAGTLANSQCTLNLASSTATPSGNDLTLVLNITFAGGFGGLKNIYMLAASAGTPTANTGWVTRGSWTVPGGAPVPVVTVTATDANASEVGLDPGTFTFTRSGDVSLALNGVTYSRTGTATPGTDFTPNLGAGGMVNFLAGQATTSLTITPATDALTEGAETVQLTVTPGAGWTVGTPASATVTIADQPLAVAAVNAVSVTPNTGTGATQAFTLQYTDSLGAIDLSSARVRFGAANVGPGTCTAWYDAAAGNIKLMDDVGVWGAPVALGAGTLANSQCTLNLATSTATPNGTNLTLVLNITFAGGFTGLKNIYMLAGSATGPNTGWVTRGTWTPHAVVGPAVVDAVSSTPNAGSGASQAFTLQYSDSHGANDLQSARVRFGATNVGPGTCTVWYDATNSTIKLMNDVGVWGAPTSLGAGTLANSQCTLNLATSTATPNGNNLTLVLQLTFAGSFTGLKNIYMLAGSATGPSTGWLTKGSWTPNPVVGGLVLDAISVTPNAGSGATQQFTLQYSDSFGATDLASARVRFGATNVGPGTCTMWYDAAANNIKLMDDAGVWGVPTALGAGTLSNSQCSVNLATSTASPSGTNLTLTLSMTFTSGFNGLKNIYMLAGSASGPSTGWVQRGTYTVNVPSGNAYDGTWTGTNSSLGLVFMTVTNGQITSFVTSVSYSGINCSGTTQVIPSAFATITNGSFNLLLFAVSGGSGFANGTFSSPTTMSGSLSVSMNTCLAGIGGTAFTATKD
jgi:subtilisin-like proprotein convertase family protein